ncbi:MAG: hypothetical protein KGI04_00295 [Candidatus Micrarchaeota archaeon]|nr:hypothetical protein [Candidatus Micrarchaeota archaeon]
MAKRSGRSASNKRLEALIRSQKINELLQIGGAQSQAILDSAGESRPTDESHVVELLESEKYTRAETSSGRPRKGSRKASAKRASKRMSRKRRR